MTSGQLKILICSSLENLGKKSECGSLFEAVGVNEISQGERREAEGAEDTAHKKGKRFQQRPGPQRGIRGRDVPPSML